MDRASQVQDLGGAYLAWVPATLAARDVAEARASFGSHWRRARVFGILEVERRGERTSPLLRFSPCSPQPRPGVEPRLEHIWVHKPVDGTVVAPDLLSVEEELFPEVAALPSSCNAAAQLVRPGLVLVAVNGIATPTLASA